MPIVHAKSPCCQETIYRFGSRRRQCRACGRTWRIRQKRRGRKLMRSTARLPQRILVSHTRMAAWAHTQSVSAAAASFRLNNAMRKLRGHSCRYGLLIESCVLLGDGLYFKFKRADWVMYVMAVKPVRSHRAFFLDPVLFQGKESYERWRTAIATISPSVKQCIRAFVSDGFRGSQHISEQNGWLHQRCHFHLLAALVRGKGKRRYRIRSSALRDKILEATRILLCSRNADTLARVRKTMEKLINRPTCPTYVRKQALEFLEREQDFRTYLRYPKLNLPTTTNSIESTGRMIRKATSTARTPESVLLRATVFLRLKKSITCNSKSSTKLTY